ncbi:hypothetical protein ACH5RR_038216 [Cinchona calisaya]|uniref:X8 domain-containing protein n=1 Tax=Cinchona calisaya TaxID=153742 RepID=A0ABD2YBF7_9GENT
MHMPDARKAAHDIFRVSSTHSDIVPPNPPAPLPVKMNALMQMLLEMVSPSSNTQAYSVSSPFSLPPYDSLAPIPLPENTPPFCVNPPFPLQPPSPPSTTIPMPPPLIGGGGGEYPPPASYSPSFPFPNPPGPPQSSIYPTPFTPPPPATSVVPSPPEYVSSPPFVYVPSPPYYSVPSPPSSSTGTPTTPSSGGPGIFVPSPPVYQPPNVYPSPLVPPPPNTAPTSTLWCVAKPSVPGPIIQEAMSYACASGAECDQIQPSGSCFEPNSLIAHASYAFNSYWQRTKVAGGTCEFGGAAILVTLDPSKLVMMGAILFTSDFLDIYPPFSCHHHLERGYQKATGYRSKAE